MEDEHSQSHIRLIRQFNHVIRTQGNIIRVMQHLAMAQSRADSRMSRIESLQMRMLEKRK